MEKLVSLFFPKCVAKGPKGSRFLAWGSGGSVLFPRGSLVTSRPLAVPIWEVLQNVSC